MSEYGIRVKVQGQSVYLRTQDISHRFSLSDLKRACEEYQIRCVDGTFKRGGTPLSDGDEIVSNDFITIDFPKAGGGAED